MPVTMPTDRTVRDWLSEYKGLVDSEFNTYANSIRHKDDVITALYNVFEQELSQEVVDPVCHQLFDFYRSGHQELQRFTLDLLPIMLLTYLSRNEKKKCGAIEASFLGIYNLEVVQKDGSPKVKTFTIPTLAAPSVYHEPPTLATLALTETALLRYHSDEPIAVTIGPFPQVESINAQNRLEVLTYILGCYNADIVNLSPGSHNTLCKMASRLSSAGFDTLGEDDPESFSLHLNDSASSTPSKGSLPHTPRRVINFRGEQRIYISSGFMVELLNGIYYSMFNGLPREGIQAIEDIHQRAEYDLYADVLLVTNAIRNSLSVNPSGQPQDGPMGISVALSPTQSNTSFSKDLITNASFRAKKLPDDIEVLDEDGEKADLPPQYEDLVVQPQDQNHDVPISSKSGVATKLTKPLKSIMKKSSEKTDKGPKVHKREPSDSSSGRGSGLDVKDSRKRTDITETHSPKSPKHSQSLSSGLSSRMNNGDIADPEMVSVQVARSGSRSTVDHLMMKTISSDHAIHRMSSSLPQRADRDSDEMDATPNNKPQLVPVNQSREMTAGTVVATKNSINMSNKEEHSSTNM